MLAGYPDRFRVLCSEIRWQISTESRKLLPVLVVLLHLLPAPSTKPTKASPPVPPPAAAKVSSSASDTGDSPPPSSTPPAAAPSHPARRRNPTRKARAARKELRPLDVSAFILYEGLSPSSETYTFDRILAHEGPLSRDHKRYKGHAFNVKILVVDQADDLGTPPHYLRGCP